MLINKLRQDIIILFQQADESYQNEFRSGNKQIVAWSEWFADYALKPLSALLQIELTVTEFDSCVIKVNEEYGTEEVSVSWMAFYADCFINLYVKQAIPKNKLSVYNNQSHTLLASYETKDLGFRY